MGGKYASDHGSYALAGGGGANPSNHNNFTNSYAAAIYGVPREENDGDESFWNRLFCCGNNNCTTKNKNSSGCYIPEDSQPGWLVRFYGVTKSKAWLLVHYGFALFLLFGSALQSLADAGRAGDAFFLWLRLLMLVFFVLDMVLRCVAEEGYFAIALSLCSNTSGSGGWRSGVGGNANGSDQQRFEFGSFLFWCDFISTLSILYDLSFINNHHFDAIRIDIDVQDGVPSQALSSRLGPNTLDFNVLVVILRTARCARFVQSRFAMDTSQKLNFYGINSCLHWKQAQQQNQQQPKQERRQYQKRSQASFVDDSLITDKNSSALATTHSTDASADKKGKRENRTQKRLFESFFLQKRKSSFGKTTNEEALESRHDAAITIQRIWRDRTLFKSDDEWEVSSPARSTTKTGPGLPSKRKGSFRLDSFRMKSIFSSFTERGGGKTGTANDADAVQKSMMESFAEDNDLMENESRSSSELVIAPKSILEAFAEKNGMVDDDDDSDDDDDTKKHRSVLDTFADQNPHMQHTPNNIATKSRFQSREGKAHRESQVGSDMRQLTGKRVAFGTLLILIFTVLCTYTESTTTQIKTMVVLHTQTKTPEYVNLSLSAAVASSVPTLYEYVIDNDTTYYPNPNTNGTGITDRNKVVVTIMDSNKTTSVGTFDNSKSIKNEAWVDVIATLFIIAFWVAGVVSFSGPVAMLVITPVEQMVRLLGMLTNDPLGYQSTPFFKQFLLDEEAMSENTGWSKDVLKGMETSFLKSTILRIGSLMKIGFGSAGVQIIQSNLKTGQNQNNLLTLNTEGTTVSCIFLFCDIRQFTDATEQLQEEVFVFTNRIAAVVHSICHSYGGAANKNVGDAFLVSWSLDEKGKSGGGEKMCQPLRAKNNQADKALLSVIRICISLTYDKFFLEPLSDASIGRLKSKLKDRKGSVVQMGFGLHAGRAVQGAIGSQRKIDAAYVAESAERSEFLESSTKKYGLKLLMSCQFHKLLHKRTRDRCRKIDRLLMVGRRGDDIGGDELMEIFTYDMDVEALHRPISDNNSAMEKYMESDDSWLAAAPPTTTRMEEGGYQQQQRQTIRKRRKGSLVPAIPSPNAIVRAVTGGSLVDRDRKIPKAKLLVRASTTSSSFGDRNRNRTRSRDSESTGGSFLLQSDLVLPKGPSLYSHNLYLQLPAIKRIRQKYVREKWFFENYQLGLEAFYNKEWTVAKKHFKGILFRFDDGPSKYFLAKIDKHNGIPPDDLRGYEIVS